MKVGAELLVILLIVIIASLVTLSGYLLVIWLGAKIVKGVF